MTLGGSSLNIDQSSSEKDLVEHTLYCSGSDNPSVLLRHQVSAIKSMALSSSDTWRVKFRCFVHPIQNIVCSSSENESSSSLPCWCDTDTGLVKYRLGRLCSKSGKYT